MPAAARVSDPQVCTVLLPAPHVGGLVQPPGVTTVLIGSKPAATQTTPCACLLGPPNFIKSGSTTVKIGNKAAARAGDPTAHGGVILLGCPTVLIGG